MPLLTLIVMDISLWTVRLWFLTPLVPIGACLFLNLLRASGVSNESWITVIWVLMIVAMFAAIGLIAIAMLMPLASLTEQLSA
jgi:hypothetical protein